MGKPYNVCLNIDVQFALMVMYICFIKGVIYMYQKLKEGLCVEIFQEYHTKQCQLTKIQSINNLSDITIIQIYAFI